MSFVFISYNHVDREYVDRLAEHLRAGGLDVWYDRDLGLGDGFDTVIERSIESSDAVVVVLSPGAAASKPVHSEIVYAEELRKPLFALLVADCRLPEDLPPLDHVDVRGGGMPGPAFVDQIRRLTGDRPPQAQAERRAVSTRVHVGIDLGTVDSSVSIFDRAGGAPVVVPDVDGALTTPSVAATDDPGGAPGWWRGRLVGTSALVHGVLHDEVAYVKKPARHVLAWLRRSVELRVRDVVTTATIATVPETDGASVVAAARAASIPDPHLLSAHAAGALAVRFEHRSSQQRALVVQLRSGHAAACLADVSPDGVEILAAAHESNLGAQRWDERIAEHLARTEKGSPAWPELGRQRVLVAARRAKEELSTAQNAEIFLPLVAPGADLFRSLDRPTFEELTRDELTRLATLVERVAPAQSVDLVVRIGGASAMPAVVEMLRTRTGRDPQPSMLSQPIAMAAAWWAAVQAADIDGPRPTLTDRTSSG